MPFALVIDDNRQTADLLCRLLSLLGIAARPAYGWRAALLAIQEDPTVDVVFLDIHMPERDGFEVLSLLRQEPGAAQVPVVIVTSDDHPKVAERARQAGVRALIVKPPSLEAIEGVLAEIRLI